MSRNNKVKLLGFWASPFATRVRIALNMKSVDYKLTEEDIIVSKSDLLLESNPVYKRVPVLIHGDISICESLVIVQYVDETWANGPPILPLDPYDRALARFWSAYVDDKLYPTFAGILYSDGDEAKRSASLDQARESISLLEKVCFVKCSRGSKFFGGGNRIGFMDIAVGSYLEWIKVTEKLRNVTLIGETETPNLFRWAQNFRADVSVKGTLPHTHELLEFSISSTFADRFKASTSGNNN